MEQILNALKAFTDRMSAKSNNKQSQDESVQNDVSEATFDKTYKSSQNTQKRYERIKKAVQMNEKDQEAQRKKDSKENSRNVVIFTGRALVEILRDQTMQKSFMTLAYISDMLVGSEISPLQK